MQTSRRTAYRLSRARRPLLVTVTTVAVAALIAGCSPSSSPWSENAQSETSAVVELPAGDELRNSIASSEAAIARRLVEMSLAATECSDCAVALTSAANAALARLDDSGGVWEPNSPSLLTAGSIEAEGDALRGAATSSRSATLLVEHSPAIDVTAPYTVGQLAAFMSRTAVQQLDAIALGVDLDAGQRRALGAIVTGRLASAYSLADQYGVDLADAVDALPSEFTPATLSSGESQGTAPSAQEDAQSSGANLSSEDGPSAVEEDALVRFDCARTALLSQASANTGAAKKSADEFNARMVALVEEGTMDGRGLRCSSPPAGLEETLNLALTTDLALLGSQSLSVRESAVAYIEKDISWWATADPLTLPETPLLTIGDENND